MINQSRRDRALPPVTVNDQPVEVVSDFKYLGTVLDKKLDFTENTDFIVKKANQRLYLLKKLRSFNVSPEILETVYRSLIESVLSFNIVVWFGNLNMKNRGRLTRIIRVASKIVGVGQYSLDDLYQTALRRKARRVVSDPTHPLHHEFQMLPLGRRYRVPCAKKNLFKKSFVPSAITVLNSR